VKYFIKTWIERNIRIYQQPLIYTTTFKIDAIAKARLAINKIDLILFILIHRSNQLPHTIMKP